jgi:hypothetical protein
MAEEWFHDESDSGVIVKHVQKDLPSHNQAQLAISSHAVDHQRESAGLRGDFHPVKGTAV